MYRRNLLKSLLMSLPASFICLKPSAIGHTQKEMPIWGRSLDTRLTGVAKINALLGGEVEGDYRGFPYTWTGYKSSLDNSSLVGQWLTYSLTSRKPMFLHREGLHLPSYGNTKIGEPVFIMSSAPGASGPFNKGAIFNVSPQPWQELLTLETPIEVLEQERAKALEVLQFEIDAYLDGSHKQLFKYCQLKSIRANEDRPPFLIEHPISVNQWLRKMTSST